MRDYLSENQFSRFSADQIFNWVYKKFVFDLEGWSNVSKKIKDHFVENIVYRYLKLFGMVCLRMEQESF